MDTVNTGYTDSELEYMREKAINDAFEMRRRATPQRTRKRPPDFGKKFFEGVGQTENEPKPPPEPCSSDFGDSFDSQRIKYDRNGAKSKGIGLQQGNDTVFIMSIIILLMSEKADFMLIFALLYILM